MGSVKFTSVRSDGLTFDFNNTMWGMVEVTGLDFPGVDLFTEKNAVGDGDLLTGKRVSSRTVEVTARSRGVALNSTNRHLVNAFFNPKYTYKNYVTYMGEQYYIDAELNWKKFPSENINRPLNLTVSFFSADPYWRSVNNFGKNIASVTPMFGFPYIQTATISTIASAFNFARQVVVENDGDVETFCTAVITAKGEVINPKIIQGNHYIKINDTLQSQDVVVIDCDKLTVYKNDVNAITLVDKSSTFTQMALQPGDTTISFSADNGDINMDVYIYYNKKYIGL